MAAAAMAETFVEAREADFPEFRAFAEALRAAEACGPPAWALPSKPSKDAGRAQAPAKRSSTERPNFPNSNALRIERARRLSEAAFAGTADYARTRRKRIAADARDRKRDVNKIELGRIRARPLDIFAPAETRGRATLDGPAEVARARILDATDLKTAATEAIRGATTSGSNRAQIAKRLNAMQRRRVPPTKPAHLYLKYETAREPRPERKPRRRAPVKKPAPAEEPEALEAQGDGPFMLEGQIDARWPNNGRARYFEKLMGLIAEPPRPPSPDVGFPNEPREWSPEAEWRLVGDRAVPDDGILARDYSLEPPHVDRRFEPKRPLPNVGGRAVRVHYALSKKRAERMSDGDRRAAILAARFNARQLHSPIVISPTFASDVPRWLNGRDYLQNRNRS